VTADVFNILGVRPAIGRLFTREDDRPGAPATMVLSYATWLSDFGGDPAVLGRSIRADDEACTVIGVMQPGVTFPATLRCGCRSGSDRTISGIATTTTFRCSPG